MPDEPSRDPDSPGTDLDPSSLEIEIDDALIQEALAAVDRAAAQRREAASKRAEEPGGRGSAGEGEGDPPTPVTPSTAPSLPPRASGVALAAPGAGAPTRSLAEAVTQPDPALSVGSIDDATRADRARLALRVRELEGELRRSRQELQRSTEICDGLDGQVRELRKAVRQAEQDAASAFGRARRERDEVERLAEERSIRSFLDIVDNVERALGHARADGVDAAAVLAGLDMIAEQFRGALRRLQVERVSAEPGTPFDPTRHDALMHLPTRDHPAGSVVNEIAAGFMLRGRLVRPARVVVAAAPAPERE